MWLISWYWACVKEKNSWLGIILLIPLQNVTVNESQKKLFDFLEKTRRTIRLRCMGRQIICKYLNKRKIAYIKRKIRR